MGAARKKKHEEHENHERWLVSYADFITLLFAFFVVLYATSTKNEEKEKSFEDSVRHEMKLGFSGGRAAGTGEGSDVLSAEMVNPLDGFPRRGGPAEVRDFVERQIKKAMTKEEQEQSGLEVKNDALGARITLAAATFFPSGSSKIKKSAVETLDKVAEILKLTGNRRIVIEGHTDDAPIATTEFPSNWELASARASSVIRYLIKYQGLEAKRMAALSYADQKPLVPNNSEENRVKNRRIEILITGESEE